MARYLFFDFDGTLYDTVEGISKCVLYALRKRGLDAPLEELRCFAGPPLDEMFREKFGLTREDSEQAVRDFRERYVPIGLYESRPFPGLKELLQELRAAGKKLAVTTSKPQVLAEELLRREGLYELFDMICGAAEEGSGNAKWQVLRRAMEALGAGEEDSVLVGDTKYDVAGALRCGIPCIGVGYGYAAPGELERSGAAAVAEDLAALRTLLLEN
ncbi:MAG: HAD hydrolase-like protein [Oscillospiraceae bacterium]|nr:HAD hydrolase-like protein [Oscillospiraceae bacterium]MBR3474628.1 HAD hydrolase-like protein [Oscillospiraceae bacterium]